MAEQVNKKIHFVAGLPRSGSTLLCNILNQNPEFTATATSGILEIILALRNQWENVTTFRAAPNKEGKDSVISGILGNYYKLEDEQIIFDKSRGWPAYIELAEFILNKRIKMLVPVRNITDVLASFEMLYRKNAHNWQFPQEKTDFAEFQTVAGRAKIFMRNNQPVGLAYNRISDALDRGYADRMHFVEFESLTRQPEKTMQDAYEFLNEPLFEHDFDHVEQTTSENDDVHGIPGLHVIRNKVGVVPKIAYDVLGETTFKKYSNAEFWRV